MIDFSNSVIFKLRQVDNGQYQTLLYPILVSGEQILSSFQSVRDGVVFTNYRIIAINVQGITGQKKDLTTMPYNKIQTFSVETAGSLDLDCELDLWFSGLGRVRFEFTHSSNVTQLCRLISEKVLGIPSARPEQRTVYPRAEAAPQPPQVTPPPQRPRTGSASYCPHCYRMLADNVDICPNCGKSVK